MSDTEKLYAVTEIEFLAVCYAIEDLKCYLIGSEFTVVTDHAALKGFIKTVEPNARLARRILALQPYRFKVVYRPGKKHGNADGCSRRTYEESGIGLDTSEPLYAFAMFAYQSNESKNRLREKRQHNWVNQIRNPYGVQQSEDPDINTLPVSDTYMRSHLSLSTLKHKWYV